MVYNPFMTAVVLSVAALLLLWLIITYNGLIRLRNRIQNAWKQIDVQLKRRHDLIPNLVAAVKGALEFERDTLEKVIAARGRAVAARGVGETGSAEGALSVALRQLFAVVESYPALRGNDNVSRLQEELTTTENQLGFARQFYNDEAMRFNTRQEVFPANIVARIFGFEAADYFAADEAERRTPPVDLSLRASSQ
jgi:LemA protein